MRFPDDKGYDWYRNIMARMQYDTIMLDASEYAGLCVSKNIPAAYVMNRRTRVCCKTSDVQAALQAASESITVHLIAEKLS